MRQTRDQRILLSLWLAASSLACGAEPIDDGDQASSDGGASATGRGGGSSSGMGGASDGGAGDGGSGANEAGYPQGELVCDGPGARFATEVAEVSYGEGQDFGRDMMPDIVFGPPDGAGATQGSLDVVSLGNGGRVGLVFTGNAIEDGPGVDFIVFENPFEVGDGVFAELATVEVSDDGETWHAFPCDAVAAPYGSCAGHRPVFLSGDGGPIDPDTAGGDGFDLADLGLARARFVRIVDRPDLDGPSGVFDLDAVGIVNAACP